MKVTSYAVARPNYYDRGATSTFGTFSGTLAPHLPVTRFTITVAASTKLNLEIANSFQLIVTAATTNARTQTSIYVNSGSNTVQVNTIDQLATPVVGVVTNVQASMAVTIYAGETVTGVTFNESTGGSIFHAMACKGTTYNA